MIVVDMNDIELSSQSFKSYEHLKAMDDMSYSRSLP